MVEIIDKDLKNFSKEQMVGIITSGLSFIILGILGYVMNYLTFVEFLIVVLIAMTYGQVTKNFYRIRNLEKK